jgi:hypothetical protein
MIVVWLNTIGLLSNILGVLMLFFWGFPQPDFSGGGALIVENANIAPDGRTYGSLRRGSWRGPHYVQKTFQRWGCF